MKNFDWKSKKQKKNLQTYITVRRREVSAKKIKTERISYGCLDRNQDSILISLHPYLTWKIPLHKEECFDVRMIFICYAQN